MVTMHFDFQNIFRTNYVQPFKMLGNSVNYLRNLLFVVSLLIL